MPAVVAKDGWVVLECRKVFAWFVVGRLLDDLRTDDARWYRNDGVTQ